LTRSLALGLVLAIAWLGDPVARTTLRKRLAAGKEDPARKDERLGHAGLPRPDGALVWFHAASVGESVSLLGLIDSLLEQRPDVHVLVTTVTRTSADLMAHRLPERAVHQYAPMDSSRVVCRFLDHWRPDVAIWTESELWPTLVARTKMSGAKMLLINGRVSSRSARRLRWVGRYMASLLGRFDRILLQDDSVADRLRALHVDMTGAEVTGSLKDTAEPLPHKKTELANLMKQTRGRPLWLAASTHEGEEELVVEAHRTARRRFPGLLLVLAPRHPERGEEVARMLRKQGWQIARRSDDQVPDRNTEVYLVDTLGEMGVWYRAAVVSFVGGSLVPVGGHNPFEPALLGSAILTGPHIANFETAYDRFLRAGAAVQVEDGADLAAKLIKTLAPDRAAELATAAWTVSSEGADVKQRVLDVILDALPAQSGG